jgi:hypothetical protein
MLLRRRIYAHLYYILQHSSLNDINYAAQKEMKV